MSHYKFTNGTTDAPDLAKMLDLRILRMRADAARDKFKGASNTGRYTTKNIVPYYKYCSPREVLTEYYRVVLPGGKEQEYRERKESMSEDPLKPEEMQRHISRIISLMFKLRKKQGKAEVDVLGPCPALAGVLPEDAQAPMPANKDTQAIKRDTLQPTDTGATEAENTLQQPPKSDAATSAMPSQAVNADSAVKALVASSSGGREQHEGVIDATANHHDWNLVEADETGYDSFAVEGVSESLDVETKDASQVEEGTDWDLCE